jgi:hypothetical protein
MVVSSNCSIPADQVTIITETTLENEKRIRIFQWIAVQKFLASKICFTCCHAMPDPARQRANLMRLNREGVRAHVGKKHPPFGFVWRHSSIKSSKYKTRAFASQLVGLSISLPKRSGIRFAKNAIFSSSHPLNRTNTTASQPQEEEDRSIRSNALAEWQSVTTRPIRDDTAQA